MPEPHGELLYNMRLIITDLTLYICLEPLSELYNQGLRIHVICIRDQDLEAVQVIAHCSAPLVVG